MSKEQERKLIQDAINSGTVITKLPTKIKTTKKTIKGKAAKNYSNSFEKYK